jgi:phospholipase C
LADIKNVFVLMLENRSFDHMLGVSGITGTDAATGLAAAINGLDGTQSNTYQGQTYTVAQPGLDAMPVDPGHEFVDVVMQLCGPAATYAPRGAYPPIDNSGFVADYVDSPSPEEGKARSNFGDIMRCMSPDQLPVLNALAREFAVCDQWHASMPGPTWPNRFFVHAASSGGLDDSPSNEDMFAWETVHGFEFKNGTVFDALAAKSATPWRIYSGGDFPNVGALKGIHQPQILPFNDFVRDVASPSYPWLYTFHRAQLRRHLKRHVRRRNVAAPARWRCSRRDTDQNRLRSNPQIPALEHELTYRHLGRARRLLRSRPTARRGGSRRCGAGLDIQ